MLTMVLSMLSSSLRVMPTPHKTRPSPVTTAITSTATMTMIGLIAQLRTTTTPSSTPVIQAKRLATASTTRHFRLRTPVTSQVPTPHYSATSLVITMIATSIALGMTRPIHGVAMNHSSTTHGPPVHPTIQVTKHLRPLANVDLIEEHL